MSARDYLPPPDPDFNHLESSPKLQPPSSHDLVWSPVQNRVRVSPNAEIERPLTMRRISAPSLLRRGFGLLLSASHDGLAGANGRLHIAQVELTEQVHGGSQHVVPEALEEDPAIFG